MQETRSTLSDKGRNVNPEVPARAPAGIIGRVLLILILFLVLRFCIQALFIVMSMTLAPSLPAAVRDFMIVPGGEVPDLTGDWQVIVSGISFAICGLLIARKAFGFSRKYTIVRDNRPPIIALAGAASVCLSVSLNLVIAKSGIMEASEGYQEVAASQYGCSFAVGLIVFGFISPVAEELLFRGIVFNGIKGYMSWKPAMILCSVLFAVYHGNGVQGIYALLMSFFIVYAYEKSGSFAVPLLMHSAANLSAYILTYACKNATDGAVNVLMLTSALIWAVLFAIFILKAGKTSLKDNTDNK